MLLTLCQLYHNNITINPWHRLLTATASFVFILEKNHMDSYCTFSIVKMVKLLLTMDAPIRLFSPQLSAICLYQVALEPDEPASLCFI